jgi:thymidylate synthase (FAD)
MKVEIIDYFGGDQMAVNVARVSFAKTASQYTEGQNAKLIKYLVEHKHTSVFRHSQLQFRVKCSIYVERQLFKHAVGISVNSVSGRYVDFSDNYYVIPFGEWRKQSKSSKQGSDGFLSEEEQYACDDIQANVIAYAKDGYDRLLTMGVSKEQARSVLPLSLETEFIWTGSFLAFMHMCNLRLKPDTQAETRDVVQKMLNLVIYETECNFTESLKAFGYERQL